MLTKKSYINYRFIKQVKTGTKTMKNKLYELECAEFKLNLIARHSFESGSWKQNKAMILSGLSSHSYEISFSASDSIRIFRLFGFLHVSCGSAPSWFNKITLKRSSSYTYFANQHSKTTFYLTLRVDTDEEFKQGSS